MCGWTVSQRESGFYWPAKSIFGMGPALNSQKRRAHLADLFALCAIRLKAQIGIQALQVRVILVSAPVHIRQHKIGLREIRVAEKSLMRAFFCLVHPTQVY